MSKHFQDARYYLRRAVEHAKEGVKEDVASAKRRVRSLVGRAREPEPSRFDEIKADLRDVKEKLGREAREGVAFARKKAEGVGRRTK